MNLQSTSQLLYMQIITIIHFWHASCFIIDMENNSGDRKINIIIAGVDGYLLYTLKNYLKNLPFSIKFIKSAFEAFNRACLLEDSSEKVNLFIFDESYELVMNEFFKSIRLDCVFWKMGQRGRNLWFRNISQAQEIFYIDTIEHKTDIIYSRIIESLDWSTTANPVFDK
jgi:hypothetical protein